MYKSRRSTSKPDELTLRCLCSTPAVSMPVLRGLCCFGVTLVYGAPQVIPSASYADEMHKYAVVDASMGAPSIYEESSRGPKCLARFDRLKYVVASAVSKQHWSRTLCSPSVTECWVLSQPSTHEDFPTSVLQKPPACRLAPAVQDWAYF